MLPGAAGNRRTLPGAAGNRRTLPGAAGNRRTLPGAADTGRAWPGAAGSCGGWLRPPAIRQYSAESALYDDGGSFTDRRVHAALESMGVKRLYAGTKKTEWFRATLADVKAAYLAVKTRTANVEKRSENFAMRPEQREAVEKTAGFFERAAKERRVKRTPKFLWNAKMRFGKTFAAYQLAKRLGAKRVLVLTFKPAVQSAWREDLVRHVDFEGWQFIYRAQQAVMAGA